MLPAGGESASYTDAARGRHLVAEIGTCNDRQKLGYKHGTINVDYIILVVFTSTWYI